MNQISFRLKQGQDLRQEIEKAAADIKAGVLVSVVGSLEVAKLRMPVVDKEIVKEFKGPFEIVSGTGTVSKHGIHIHLSVSDGEGRVIGGHLKNGCIVRTTAEIVLLAFDDVEYKRKFDEKTGYAEFSIE